VLELLVSTDLGGGPTHVRDLLAGLSRDEFDLTVAGPPGGGAVPLFESLGVDFVPVHADRLSFSTLRSVIRLARERRIEVIHSHGKGAGLYGHIASRWTGARSIHTFHGIHYRDYPLGVRGLYLSMERFLARSRFAVIHVSESQFREAERLSLESPERRHIIVNATDYAVVQGLVAGGSPSRHELGLDPSALVLGTVARFDRVKGLDVLLEAFARVLEIVPTGQLLLVGGGPEDSRLRDQVRRLGIAERVVFAGPRPESARCLPAMDLYVTASRREGLPLAVLEAMAGGLAVVATRVIGHEDVVEEGVTGLLVPPDNPEALAEVVARLLPDASRRRIMGEAGRLRVQTQFAVPRMIAQIGDLYRSAVGRFGSG
jgi:glycosyltransferase involved in cell wall biosynthesis